MLNLLSLQPLLEAEDANMDDAYLAPCTFVALDMLEARLEALQMQMHQVSHAYIAHQTQPSSAAQQS